MDFYIFHNNIWNLLEKSNNFVAIYPEILLIFIISFLLVFLVVYDYFSKYKLLLVKIANLLSMLTFIFLLVILINNLNIHFTAFQSLLIIDNFNIIIKLIITVFSVLLAILSIDYFNKEKIINYEFIIIFFLSFLGLLFLISSYDLLSMYLSVELQALSFYILATFKQYTNFSTEAGMKYFILGAFSSGILLYGSSILYGFTGLTDFYSLEIFFQNTILPLEILNSIIIGIIFIITGFLFKIAAAPFHMWSPDVYEGSPTIVTAIFAIIPKIVIIGFLFRFSLAVLNFNIIYVNKLFLLSAFFSLLIGSLAAIYQVKLKRLLAYSSISHVGFLLIGIAIMSLESYYSTFFYAFTYMILSLNIFAILLSIRQWSINKKIKKISEVILLLKSNSVITMLFIVNLFSIAGIPPLVGFYSKLYIFISGVKTDFIFVIIIAAIISVFSSFYYLRLIKLMTFKINPYVILLNNVSYLNSLIISLTFIFNFFFLFSPNILITFIHNCIIFIFI